MRTLRCLFVAVLAAVMVTVAAARQPGGFVVSPTFDYAVVLTNVPLQEELKVTAEQKTKLKPAMDKQEALNKERRELSGKDALAAFQEKSKKVNEEIKKDIDDTLTADQKKRFKQIGIQSLSFTVFNDQDAPLTRTAKYVNTEAHKALIKDVADALKLSDEQKKTVKGIRDGLDKETGEIRREVLPNAENPKLDREKIAAGTAKIDKIRKEAWVKIETVFDDTQKKAWKELIGDPFDVAKLQPVPKR